MTEMTQLPQELEQQFPKEIQEFRKFIFNRESDNDVLQKNNC